MIVDKNRTKLCKIYCWCLSYLKKYAVFVYIYILLRFVYEMCNILIPQIIREFIDRVLANQEYGAVRNLALMTICIVITMIVSYIITKYMDLVFVEKGTRAVQCDVFDKTRIVGFKHFENTPRGETLGILANNVISIYFLFLLYVTQTVSLVLSFILSFTMIVRTKNLIFILTLIISSICIIVINTITSRRVDKLGIRQAEAGLEYNRRAYDSIESINEIHAFGVENWNIKRVLSSFSLFKMLNIKLQFVNSIRSYVVVFFKSIAIIVYFLISIKLIRNNAMSIGNTVATFIYYNMFFTSLSQFCKMIYKQNKLLYDAEKPYEFMKMEPDIKICTHPVKKNIAGLITLENVGFSYNKEKILNNISVRIEKGEKVALVGASGEGKSTLLKLLIRCYDCTEGTIYFDKTPINRYSLSSIRDSVGIVFQETFLFSMSVMDNLRFGNPKATEKEIIEAAKLARAHEFISALPQSYNTVLGDKGNTLSGGQQQRLSIARIILKNPQILLLDEVTSDLDYINEKHILKTIKTAMKEKTVIMTTHRLSVIKNTERILVIQNGTIVEDGDYETLINKKGNLYKLVSKGIVKDD